MAKRKPKPKPQPKPAVAAILGLAEDAFIALETAQTWHSAIEYLKAKIASNRKMAAAQEAKANRRLKRAAHLVRALPPDELADLLSRAPAWFRTILVQTI